MASQETSVSSTKRLNKCDLDYLDSPDHIFQLLMARERTKQLEYEIKLKELDLLKNQTSSTKKRSFDILINDQNDDQQYSKVLKKKKKEFLCQDVILLILEYLNVNFNAFKMLFVSKDFYQSILNLKSLTICLKINEDTTMKFDSKTLIRKFVSILGKFIESNIYKTIEKLNISDFISDTINLSIPIKYFPNILLFGTRLKHVNICNNSIFGGEFKFTKPTIETLIVQGECPKLAGRNFFNLKCLTIGSGNFTLAVNHFTRSIEVLNCRISNESCISELSKLRLLRKLNIQQSLVGIESIIYILGNIPSLESLKCNVQDSHLENVEQLECPSIECEKLRKLVINLEFSLDILSNVKFPNLEILRVRSSSDEFVKSVKFFQNNSMTNLKQLNYGPIIDETLRVIFQSKFLTNLEELILDFTEMESTIFFKQMPNTKFNLNRLEMKVESIQTNCVDFGNFNHFTQLTHLYLCTAHDTDLICLATSNSFPNLKRLDAYYSYTSEDKDEEYYQSCLTFTSLLARNPSYRNIEILFWNCVQDDEVLALKNSPHLEKLREIAISENERITSVTYKLLSEWDVKVQFE